MNMNTKVPMFVHIRFKNLFRRKENKLKNRYFIYQMCVFYPESEINNVFNKDNVNYEYDRNTEFTLVENPTVDDRCITS